MPTPPISATFPCRCGLLLTLTPPDTCVLCPCGQIAFGPATSTPNRS